MCLIVFAYRAHPRYSLVVVANRDEFFQRPSAAAHWWEDNADVYGGRDLERGGTWLGLSASGRLAAVTNYRDGHRNPVGKRSRGALTRDFLTQSLGAENYLQKIQPQAAEYGGFNLLMGDASGLYYMSGETGQYIALSPGVYGLSNASLDTPWPKVVESKQAPSLAAESLAAILHDATEAPDDALPDTGISDAWEKKLSARFIRMEGYGTRSTAVLLQQSSGETAFFEQTFEEEGPRHTSTEQIVCDVAVGGG